MTLNTRVGFLQACELISPIHPEYTIKPIEQGFDWEARLGDCDFASLYLVVFRSVRRESADQNVLREFDDMAYEAALGEGGLLKYFKGVLNERRECLSFCLWETREQARAAAGGSSHGKAAEITAAMYESYRLYRYNLVKSDGELVFEPLGEQAQEFGSVSKPVVAVKRG